MAYQKLDQFETQAVALERVLIVRDAPIPDFDRAEILADDAGDCILSVARGDKRTNYRVERDGQDGWVRFGGVVLAGRR